MTTTHAPGANGPDAVSPSRLLPPLAALRCFAVAARTGSFTRAAEELCVTQGAVSRQVLQLEEFYGQALFLRQARGLVLTDAGRLLASTARSALDQIAQTTRVLRRRMEAPELRFMVPTCAMLWAMPLLMRFQGRHPGFRIAVSTTMSHHLDDDRFDAGIVYDRLDAPAPHQRLLFAERLTPVCSPRLTHGAQALRRPKDLARSVLLHARTDHEDWRQWLEAAQLHEIDPALGLDFQTLDLSNSAAAEGYGVALGDRVIGQPAIDSGRLCAPFDFEVTTGHGYFLRWQEAHAERAEIAHLAELFGDALREQLDGAAPQASLLRKD
ncbi:LysR substrate-binding domain-containing protein [Variovorax sp. RT4R15]|uniref:LysR substrate-binding domain-containing protein n=1 Tax=Variovorax sp. RT4R15 TaxID=3443737 RepID=UPI003F486293